MERMNLKTTIRTFASKYRYVALVLAIGLALMLLPTVKTEEAVSESTDEISENDVSIQEQLSDILSQIRGAGRVQVMLTVRSGQETVYQSNDNTSTGTDTETHRTDTVTITDAERNEIGLIKQINPPVYLGAIVVCEGADSPSVQLAIVEAVASVTGLGSDNISVLKMK